MKVHVSRCLKEELSWAIDKRLQLIVNAMLFKTVSIGNRMDLRAIKE